MARHIKPPQPEPQTPEEKLREHISSVTFRRHPAPPVVADDDPYWRLAQRLAQPPRTAAGGVLLDKDT